MRTVLTYTIEAFLVCHHFRHTRDICMLDVDTCVVVEISISFSIFNSIWDLSVLHVSLVCCMLLATCVGSVGLISIDMEIVWCKRWQVSLTNATMQIVCIRQKDMMTKQEFLDLSKHVTRKGNIASEN